MFELPNFALIGPELFLFSMTLFILLMDLIFPFSEDKIVYRLGQVTLLGTFLLCASLFHHPKTVSFSGHFILDPVSTLLKCSMDFVLFIVFLYARNLVFSPRFPWVEFYVLGLFALLGMHVLASAGSFVTLFLGLELFSLSLYAMIAFQRDLPITTEAAMKYFLMGAVASGILLYGLSMIYGATKALDMPVVFQAISGLPVDKTLILIFGLVFITVGVAFKLGMAPFHMWVPDIYEGAPSVITLFIATAPKIAALSLAIRLLVDTFPYYHMEWQHMFIFIALLSMGIGNMVAILQTNLKRLLAYSSIAHMGYMSLGLISGIPGGYGGSIFYMMSYVLMSLGAFGMMVLLSRLNIKVETLDDFKGLHHRAPWLAFLMLLIMFSMAGVPPTVGFFAKMAVLEALVKVHLVWLAIVAILFAIVGAYYYLRVVKVMYFDKPTDEAPLVIQGLDKRLVLSLNGLVLLGFGLFPSGLFNLCRGVF